MISLENLLLFVPLAAILVMLPGPDFALIAKVSLLDGRPQGQAAALGVALGICLHTMTAMLGISAIIAQSVLWFSILKYLGAAYLIWLGIHALRSSRAVSQAVVKTAPLPDAGGLDPCGPTPDHAGQSDPNKNAPDRLPRLTPRQWRHFFGQGFLTNALNPKVVLIFLTFLPQFMDPRAPLAPQFLELGGILAALCLLWYVPLAFMLGHVRKAFESTRFQKWLYRFTGVVFIAFGLKLATAHSQ